MQGKRCDVPADVPDGPKAAGNEAPNPLCSKHYLSPLTQSCDPNRPSIEYAYVLRGSFMATTHRGW